LIKNSRIYTLNYNLKSLKRKESVDELYKFRIGDNIKSTAEKNLLNTK